MKEIKGKVKRAVQILWENKYRMTYYMLILCILFGCIHYAESGIWSSANISFNYSEASLGLSPNKTRFNAYEIVSEEVMQRAIEKVGLQGSISASELASHVFITPEGTGHVGGSDDYISTSYNINLNADGLELKNRTTISLLKSICEAYREFFQKNYCDNQDMLKEKLEITTDCEPYLRLNELELRAECIMQYLNARLSENKSYVDTENPDSSTNNFTTLSKQINNIVDYDIPNVKAYVIEGGIAKDASLLISILEYKNKIDDIAAQITEIVKDPFTAQQLPIQKLEAGEDGRTFTFQITSSQEAKKDSTDKDKGPKKEIFFFSYDYPTRKLTWLKEKKKETEYPDWASFSPDGKTVVYAKDLNLYRMSREDYEKLKKDDNDSTVTDIQLTTFGVKDFGFGQPYSLLNTDTLCNGKRKGVWGIVWSPDSRYFAVTVRRACRERLVGNQLYGFASSDAGNL